MDTKLIINILIALFIFYMLISFFHYILSLIFSKIGLSVIIIIWILYVIWYKVKYEKRNFKINNSYENLSFFEKIKNWYNERKRKYYYEKYKKMWETIQLKYGNNLKCPYCNSDITVFNITEYGECNFCKNKLI